MLDRQPFFLGQPHSFCNRAKRRTLACLAVWLSFLDAPLPFIMDYIQASFANFRTLPLCSGRTWLLLVILGFCFCSMSCHLDFHCQQMRLWVVALVCLVRLNAGRSLLPDEAPFISGRAYFSVVLAYFSFGC